MNPLCGSPLAIFFLIYSVVFVFLCDKLIKNKADYIVRSCKTSDLVILWAIFRSYKLFETLMLHLEKQLCAGKLLFVTYSVQLQSLLLELLADNIYDHMFVLFKAMTHTHKQIPQFEILPQTKKKLKKISKRNNTIEDGDSLSRNSHDQRSKSRLSRSITTIVVGSASSSKTKQPSNINISNNNSNHNINVNYSQKLTTAHELSQRQSLYNNNIQLELRCKLIIISESSDGCIYTKIFEAKLKKYSESPDYNLLVGSVTGASNTSGIIERHDEITSLLHKYNALLLCDYAANAPYLNTNLSQTKVGDAKTQQDTDKDNTQDTKTINNHNAQGSRNVFGIHGGEERNDAVLTF